MYALNNFRIAIGVIFSIFFGPNAATIFTWAAILTILTHYYGTLIIAEKEIALELKALELAKLLVELERMDTVLEALETAKIALGEEIKTELKAIDIVKQLIKLEAIDAEKAEIAKANKEMWDWVNARVEATTPECEKKWGRPVRK